MGSVDDEMITELRDYAVIAKEDHWHVSPELFTKAADEIERLRAEIASKREGY